MINPITSAPQTVCAILTAVKPLETPVVMPRNESMSLESSPAAKVAGAGVVLLTLILYAIFW